MLATLNGSAYVRAIQKKVLAVPFALLSLRKD